MAAGRSLLLLWHWPCCGMCCVTFLYINFSSTSTLILNLSTWLYYKKANRTQNSVIYSAGGNIVNFSHTSRLSISTPFLHCKLYGQIFKKCRKPCQKQPLPLEAHGLPSNTWMPGPTPLTCQMTARSLYALPHNDITKSPLVTMGRHKCTPKLPLPLRRSPSKSNTPIPSPTPLTTLNGIRIQSAVLPQYTCAARQTGGRHFSNISALLAILIESDVLIICNLFCALFLFAQSVAF